MLLLIYNYFNNLEKFINLSANTVMLVFPINKEIICKYLDFFSLFFFSNMKKNLFQNDFLMKGICHLLPIYIYIVDSSLQSKNFTWKWQIFTCTQIIGCSESLHELVKKIMSLLEFIFAGSIYINELNQINLHEHCLALQFQKHK